jgi:peptidoglycan/xylan/chitin deacetylase (PgdA/CDA1 family)
VKHRLKLFLREVWVILLYYTGLHALVSRMMPRRLTILASHCVAHSSNDFLPPDMKISREKMGEILDRLGRHHDLVNVSEGWRRLSEGSGRSMVALTMDDGYRDNLEVLLPMLAERGISATVYLESRPLDDKRLNWTHYFFWSLGRISPFELVERYRTSGGAAATCTRLDEVLAEGGDLTYTLKKVFKYETDQTECAETLARIFAELGGDERSVCEELYLSWDDARALREGGVELGGHTVHHPVLATLDETDQRREVADGRRALVRELGAEIESFAYPFGRPWDFDERTMRAVRAAGFVTATTTGAGTNTAKSDPIRLERLMIGESSRLPEMVVEASGGFLLLRRLGINLSV